jgi:hypothetical protein
MNISVHLPGSPSFVGHALGSSPRANSSPQFVGDAHRVVLVEDRPVDLDRPDRRRDVMLHPFLAAMLLAFFSFPDIARAQVVGHPEGCPRRAFCGCGASVHLFGRPVRELFLASNWLKFPRAAPGYNMAAVRRGHVFILKQQIDGNIWLVYDANSGGRQTRLHHRSLAGYTIVDPQAGRF